MKMKKLLLTLTPLFLFTGCALTKSHVSLEYKSPMEASTIPEAENVHTALHVTDSRNDKKVVGHKKNGYGMQMASIHSKEDVATFLQNSITLELEKRGFQVNQTNLPHLHIDIELLKFYNDYKIGYFTADANSEVIFTIKVTDKENKIAYSRNINAQGTEGYNLLMGGKNAKLSLEDAVQSALKELFEDKAFLTALLPQTN